MIFLRLFWLEGMRSCNRGTCMRRQFNIFICRFTFLFFRLKSEKIIASYIRAEA